MNALRIYLYVGLISTLSLSAVRPDRTPMTKDVEFMDAAIAGSVQAGQELFVVKYVKNFCHLCIKNANQQIYDGLKAQAIPFLVLSSRRATTSHMHAKFGDVPLPTFLIFKQGTLVGKVFGDLKLMSDFEPYLQRVVAYAEKHPGNVLTIQGEATTIPHAQPVVEPTAAPAA